MSRWSSFREETWRDVMEWRALLYPDKPALICSATGVKRTFKELNERVNQLANALIDHGLKKGDRIAVLATDIPEYFEIACTSKAGLVEIGLVWRLKGQELAYIINDSGANTVFVEEQFCETIRSIRPQLPKVKTYICIDGSPKDMLSYEELLSKYPANDPGVDVCEDDLLTLVYTSGSTGLPKGVIRKHGDILRFARMFMRALGVRNDDRCLSNLPLSHVSLFHINFLYLMAGATQWLVKRFDPPVVLELIQREKLTFLLSVPTMVISLTEDPYRAKCYLGSLRCIWYVGSPMPAEGVRRGMDAFGPILGQIYGLTEGTGLSFLYPEEQLAALKDPAKHKILTSAGKPIPGCQMRLVDDNDNDVPIGELGEIAFRSDCIIEGYWNKPEETKATMKNGWMHTGDIGKLDKNGYLYVVDRKKDVIVSGGENVASKEVEAVIYTHPAVLECAVIGVPSERWGEEVKAIVSLRRGMTATPDEIVDYCDTRMAGFKKPKSVEIWPELPKDTMGKIMKKAMREKYWAGYERRVH